MTRDPGHLAPIGMSGMSDIVDRILDLMQSRGLMADEDDAKRVIAAVLDALAEPSEAMQLAGHNVRNDPETGLPTSCGTDEIYRAMLVALRKEIEDE